MAEIRAGGLESAPTNRYGADEMEPPGQSEDSAAMAAKVAADQISTASATLTTSRLQTLEVLRRHLEAPWPTVDPHTATKATLHVEGAVTVLVRKRRPINSVLIMHRIVDSGP